MIRMNWRFVLLTFHVLMDSCLWPVTVASDEISDVGREDVDHNILTETNREVLDMDIKRGSDVPDTNFETNWNTNKDNYEDADWHPPSSILETHSDLLPDSPQIHDDNTGADNNNQNYNWSPGRSSIQCGEYSCQLMSNGKCRITAMLPSVPVGTSQRFCPDMLRCTDDISHWLHENQNRKEELEELRKTMLELQEELRNHQHQVKTLEMQVH